MDSNPKKRIRKSKEIIQQAINIVLEGKMSIRSAASEFNIAKSMLARLVAKAKAATPENRFIYEPNIGNRRIFTTEEEVSLTQYLKLSSKMAHGLTYLQTRDLAYQYAVKLSKVVPENWTVNEKAGIDWMKLFMKRHPELSLRRPEKTSLSRATAFNPTTVKTFFKKLEETLTKYSFTGDRIYNADETGLTTVNELPSIIAERGAKQVGHVTSAERGQLVTMLAFVSATGNHVAPVFIFPRVRFKEFMLDDCPTGSLGLCHKSGWMTSDNFFIAFKHFVEKVRPSKENPVLLLIDNHESHINIDVINHARENGVVILTFPPHCSHKLQPLDISVYGPFKNYFKIAQNDWMVSNPGKTISIYHLPKFAKSAFISAFTPKNICSGFSKAGIHPFNKNIFGEQDFLYASVTDHEDPNQQVEHKNSNLEVEPHQSCSTDTTTVISPVSIRPFPKAPARQSSLRGRKKGSSRIITATPEKNEIEESCALKKIKLSKINNRSADLKKKQVKRKVLVSSSSESSNEDDVVYAESDDSLEWSNTIEPEVKLSKNATFNVDDFVVVKFVKKKLIRHFVGQVIEVMENGEATVKFLKKINENYHFIFPENEDLADIEAQDIILKLPPPVNNTGTARVKAFYSFAIDLSHLL